MERLTQQNLQQTSLIDESYIILKRLDNNPSSLEKVVVLAKEIETNKLQVLKLFLPDEQNFFEYERTALDYIRI